MKVLSFVPVSAAILLLLLSACVGGSLSDPLNGSSWTATAINDIPALGSTSVMAEFIDGKIGGSSGCNSYGGAYKASGKKITTDSININLNGLHGRGCDGTGKRLSGKSSECANLRTH